MTQKDAYEAETVLHWNDLRVSCPACAAPAGRGCFIPRLGGHQNAVVHRKRREAER